jgi:carboxypeptidase family protein
MEPSTPSVALRALRLIQTSPLHLHFLVWFVILTCATASAQKDTGAIAGLVKDSSGAVVSGAEVTITDTDRGTSLVLKTNAQGEYVASPLKIGRYKVTVEKAGFKKAVAGPIVVNVQERPEIDVTMQVGSISETMTVTTETPQLETETSELG